MKRIFLGLILLPLLASAVSTHEYLPADRVYNPDIPTPEQVLGMEVGEKHLRPDQIVTYFRALEAASDRIRIEVIGHSHENRPLINAYITTGNNHENLDQLRQKHLDHEPDAPVVVLNGYSIHGNEASGSNASVLFAYYLVAGESEAHEKMLANTVLILDPMFNPDGLARAAQWFNQHLGQVRVADPENRDHREGWPNGRTNHYWFDLNRDWLLVQHPESQARIKQFRKWRPHILTDAHEMGSNATYFFQPGVPERTNPLTPAKNQQLTKAIALFHASALDERGELYFTEEQYDDFYYGKGSTYPDLNGSIGILFEQASSRGHLVETPYGVRTFEDSIHNQLSTSLSTLAAANALATDLKAYRQAFDKETAKLANERGSDAWLITAGDDIERLNSALALMAQHGIKAYQPAGDIKAGERVFQAGKSAAIPLNQASTRLIESLFEVRTTFKDNTFYDVSSWNLPMAFNLEAAKTRLKKPGQAISQINLPESTSTSDALAIAIDWNQLGAARLLHKLLAEDVMVLSVSKPFEAGEEIFSAGSLVIPVHLQQDKRALIENILTAAKPAVETRVLNSGLTSKGPDLGSRDARPVKPVKLALLTGRGVSPYDAGEIWHHVDTRLAMPITLLPLYRVASADLSVYTHIIMPNGRYTRLEAKEQEAVEEWITSGGTLLAIQGGADWAAKKLFAAKKEKTGSTKKKEESVLEHKRYADYDKDYADRVIGGAFYQLDIDSSHPVAWGYDKNTLAIFKKGTTQLKASTNAYEMPAYYSKKVLLAGYSSTEMQKKFAGEPAIISKRKGKGSILMLGFNPLFRAYTRGTERVFDNAIFHAQKIRTTRLPE